MKECIDLTFHAQVIVKDIAVKVVELKGILFEGGALERHCNIGFYQSSASKSDKVLKTLHKEYNVFIVQVFFH